MKRMFTLLLSLMLVIGACTPAASPTATTPPLGSQSDTGVESTPIPSSDASGEATEMATAETAGASMPMWMTLPLTNARTGATFTLADFEGRTVYVQAMALWCTTCRGHQRVLRDTVISQLDANTVFISLDIESDAANTDVATYADAENFDWLFAVVTPEVLASLAQTFGQTIAVPPTTPRFIVRADRTFTPLYNGGADDLAILREAGAA